METLEITMVVAVTMASRTKIVNFGLLSGGPRFFLFFSLYFAVFSLPLRSILGYIKNEGQKVCFRSCCHGDGSL